MEIRNTARISAPVETVWQSIIDIEATAGCVPGATLGSRLSDDSWAGEIRVKVGPLALAMAGDLRAEIDEPSRILRLHGRARDRRGLGEAIADLTLHVRGDAGLSVLDISADLRLVGRLAQVGRQAIVAPLTARLLGEFARCLETRLAEA